MDSIARSTSILSSSDVLVGGYRISRGPVVDGTIVVGATAAVGSSDDDDDDVGSADGELDRLAMGCTNDGTIDEGCPVGFGFVKGAAEWCDTVGTIVPAMVGQGVQEHIHVHVELRYCLTPSLPSTILTANPFPVDNDSDDAAVSITASDACAGGVAVEISTTTSMIMKHEDMQTCRPDEAFKCPFHNFSLYHLRNMNVIYEKVLKSADVK
eukprot:gene29627-38750_t